MPAAHQRFELTGEATPTARPAGGLELPRFGVAIRSPQAFQETDE